MTSACWLPPELLVPLRCVVCGSCALAFLRRAPAFLAAVGASWGWAERLLVAALRAQVKETVSDGGSGVAARQFRH